MLGSHKTKNGIDFREYAAAAGLFISFIGYFIFLTALTGLVFSSLWGWFVVPLGYPKITIFHALGLATIVSSLRVGSVAPSSSESPKEAFLKPVLALGGSWLFGFVCHLYM